MLTWRRRRGIDDRRRGRGRIPRRGSDGETSAERRPAAGVQSRGEGAGGLGRWSKSGRRWEAESIIPAAIKPKDFYLLCGDFNDTPDSTPLRPILKKTGGGLGLVNLVVRDVLEAERWTATHKETGEPRRFEQIDYVLVPKWAEGKVTSTRIDRRKTTVTVPDGSDHDPIYCEIKP